VFKPALILFVFCGVMPIMSHASDNLYPESNHFKDGKFHNEEVNYEAFSWGKMAAITKAYINDKSDEASPKQAIPIIKLTTDAVNAMPNNSVVRLSHSTLLFKLEGQFFLTDPVFSERASPVSFIGSKRFHPSPISISDLPPIKAVIMSHDHYDHLDQEAIKALKEKVEHFYTPLGVGKRLIDFGIAKERVSELDWWESVSVGHVSFTATPAQHFSGRGLFDGNDTLWASWVIKTPAVNLFFSGDSGYFTGFKRIGEALGPFDMSFIETGAYNALWSEIHMFPHESVQAHIDLNAKFMFPIHNGTFDLALHSWQEPLNLVAKHAKEKNVAIRFPKMGEVLSIQNPHNTPHWWLEPAK